MVLKAGFMVRISQLKFCLCAANIFHCSAIIGCDRCLVDNGTRTALPIHGARLSATVARFCCNRSWFAKASVMAIDNGLHVGCATITDFHGVSIEYLAVSIVRGKMLVDEV